VLLHGVKLQPNVTRMKGLAAAAMALVLASLLTASGCKDQAKESARLASGDVDTLAALVDKDIGEIERGLPVGATKLQPLYADGADPSKDVPAVRQALLRMQRNVPDLNVAKSTFFALTDQNGVGIRNNLEQDAMAGQDLKKLFPGISKAIAGEYTETTGSFGGPPTPKGPDKDWIAASPVKNDQGKVAGLLVTGWSYRRFASHLQQVLKEHFQTTLRKSGDTGKMPVFYVAVFDPSGVYSERTTPKIDEQALVDQKLVDKTKSGAAQGTVTITERAFGWAAKRTPKLGPDTGIVVLRSEL
jgi:hypothetical protein